MSWLIAMMACSLAMEGGLSAPPTPAPVRLARLDDPVAKLDGESSTEETLFHFDKYASLKVGDGVRQGVAGSSELFFPSDFSTISNHGETCVRLDELSDTKRVLRYEQLRSVRGEVRTAGLTLMLPGKISLETTGKTRFDIRRQALDNRMIVKNIGPSDLRVGGELKPEGVGTIGAGGEMIFLRPGDPVEQAKQRERPVWRWQGRTVRADDSIATMADGDRLVVTGRGTAVVGGARIRLPNGGRIRIWTPHR